MSGSVSFNASMSFQNVQNSSGSNLKNLYMQYDMLTKKRISIEKSTALSQKEKETKLAQIDKELQMLAKQIENAEKTEDKKQQQKQMEEKAEQLNNSTDPKTAEMMLKAEQLTRMAVSKEASEVMSDQDIAAVLTISDTAREYLNEKMASGQGGNNPDTQNADVTISEIETAVSQNQSDEDTTADQSFYENPDNQIAAGEKTKEGYTGKNYDRNM